MAAKWKPFIKWLPKTDIYIIFDKIVNYYLELFFICLDLCCIHTICLTLESLDHAVQCLWGCGDLQRCRCHGNTVRVCIYCMLILQNSLILPLKIVIQI